MNSMEYMSRNELDMHYYSTKFKDGRVNSRSTGGFYNNVKIRLIEIEMTASIEDAILSNGTVNNDIIDEQIQVLENYKSDIESFIESIGCEIHNDKRIFNGYNDCRVVLKVNVFDKDEDIIQSIFDRFNIIHMDNNLSLYPLTMTSTDEDNFSLEEEPKTWGWAKGEMHLLAC